MNAKWGLRTRLGVVSAALLLTTVGHAVEQSAEVSLSPYLLPIEIGWSTSDGWVVSFRAAQVPTPLGVLSVKLTLPQASERYGARILLVTVGDQSQVFSLGGRRFVLDLPDNLRGQSTLTYADGSIHLAIPTPNRGAVYKTRERLERSPTLLALFQRLTDRVWPKWLEPLQTNPIEPNLGLAGLRLGDTEDSVVATLGWPSAINPDVRYDRHNRAYPFRNYIYTKGALLLGVYVDVSENPGRISSIRYADGALGASGLTPRTIDGLGVGSSERQIKAVSAEPLQEFTHYTEQCPGSKARMLEYLRFGFSVCDSHSRVYLIDLK